LVASWQCRRLWIAAVRRCGNSPADMARNAIISAVSNFSTAYNLIVINVVHVVVQNQYCGGDKCKDEVALASTSCLVGAILGQLTFGYIGDCLGRSPALQLTMAFSILGAALSAVAIPISDEPSSIFYFLSITRFFLGLGVGGVYPLSATIAAESSNSKSRGRTSALVFSMQGVASLTVPLVALLLLRIFNDPKQGSAGDDMGWAWRFALGLGALPGILLLPFKISTSRSPQPTQALASQDAADESSELESPLSAADPERVTLFQALCMREYWGKLIGTAGTWFLFDITFYGNSLFQPTVLHKVFNVKDGNPVDGPTLQTNICLQMSVIALIGLPGYYMSVWLMDIAGPRRIQLQGFLFMAIAFGALGIWQDQLADIPDLMLILYGLTFFFSNFGPNSTTFMLPAETFPAHIRTTLNGFSAASGKVGAVVGSSAFKPLATLSLTATMIVCAVISLVGFVVTYFFVEDRRGLAMEGDEDARSTSEADESLKP